MSKIKRHSHETTRYTLALKRDNIIGQVLLSHVVNEFASFLINPYAGSQAYVSQRIEPGENSLSGAF
jgi:hypothetical protein